MSGPATWRLDREWMGLTLAAAGLVASLDATLLQLRRDYFTGGFLSTDAATAWGDRLAFAGGAIATNAVLAGLGVAVVLLLASAGQWGRLARWFLALAAGAGPLLIASLVEYEVVAQLGDAFDARLMFDLVGRRPSEFFAVASGHLVWPLVLLGLLLATLVVVAWRLQRRWPSGARRATPARLVVNCTALALTGTLVHTGLRLGSDVLDNGLRRTPAGQVLGTVVDAASDVDRDGFGLLGRPSDPDPWDARVYPYALDQPGNGIDEDGVGGDLPPGPAYTEASAPTPRFVRTPDVVIVMLETFRADLLGATHEGREVTPVLNALARDGAAAARAYSHNGYTVQSRYHLLTGSLAGLRPGTLLDDFQANGYEVAYFSAQDESFGGARFDVGLDRADVFYDARQDKARRYTTFATAGSLGVPSDVVLERIGTFLGERTPDRPLLLYVNFYDTHFPYQHDGMASLVSETRLAQGEIVPARAAELRAMYSNAAAHVDAAVGHLLAHATARLGEAPAVVVLADHGESLFDGGFLGHGYALDEVQTRIPLVVRGLGLSACEPLGQGDLRDAITSALADEAAGTAPAFRRCETAEVFQYLGLMHRPPQIALVSPAGRVTYDFRQHLVRRDDGPWRAPETLDADGREAWLRVVHRWERLRLAQAAAGER